MARMGIGWVIMSIGERAVEICATMSLIHNNLDLWTETC